jgi:hypothetical protein
VHVAEELKIKRAIPDGVYGFPETIMRPEKYQQTGMRRTRSC